MPSPISLFELLMSSFTSDRLERITAQLHQAIITVITVSIPHRQTPIGVFENPLRSLPDILRSLTVWKSRPRSLTSWAYEWCSVICERCPDLEANYSGSRELLFLSLEVGFRHLDFRAKHEYIRLTHTEHHRRMVDVVFKHGTDEVIADFLHAWTQLGQHSCYQHPSLHTCASRLVDLQHLQPFSPRLRHLLISSIGSTKHKVRQIGNEISFDVLDGLRVCVEDICVEDFRVDEFRDNWADFLLSVIQSVDGTHFLSYPYWELMVELLASSTMSFRGTIYSPLVIGSLEDAREWHKLGCWIAIVWAIWGPDGAANLEPATLSLFHNQPGTFQKLERWIEALQRRGWNIEQFQSLCEQRNLNVAGPDTP